MSNNLVKSIEDDVEILTSDVSSGLPSHRNWVAVLYPENMIPDWENKIYRILQVPFCYIVHDKDTIEDMDDLVTTFVEYTDSDGSKQLKKEVVFDNAGKRKTHIHLMIHYSNTTTYKTALEVFKSLSAIGKRCVNTCQYVRNISYMWHYFCHNTEDCKKANKYLYPSSDRICGNNWDLGAFIALEQQTNDDLLSYITDYAVNHNYFTYLDIVLAAKKGVFNGVFEKVDAPVPPFTFVKNNRGYLVEVTKSLWQKDQQKKENKKSKSKE